MPENVLRPGIVRSISLAGSTAEEEAGQHDASGDQSIQVFRLILDCSTHLILRKYFQPHFGFFFLWRYGLHRLVPADLVAIQFQGLATVPCRCHHHAIIRRRRLLEIFEMASGKSEYGMQQELVFKNHFGDLIPQDNLPRIRGKGSA